MFGCVKMLVQTVSTPWYNLSAFYLLSLASLFILAAVQ